MEFACEVTPLRFLDGQQAPGQRREPFVPDTHLLEQAALLHGDRHRVGDLGERAHVTSSATIHLSPQQVQDAHHAAFGAQRQAEGRAESQRVHDLSDREVQLGCQITHHVWMPCQRIGAGWELRCAKTRVRARGRYPRGIRCDEREPLPALIKQGQAGARASRQRLESGTDLGERRLQVHVLVERAQDVVDGCRVGFVASPQVFGMICGP